jgi:hypothetical protein
MYYHHFAVSFLTEVREELLTETVSLNRRTEAGLIQE